MHNVAAQSHVCADAANDIKDGALDDVDHPTLLGTRLEWLYSVEGDDGMSRMLAPLFSVALFRRPAAAAPEE